MKVETMRRTNFYADSLIAFTPLAVICFLALTPSTTAAQSLSASGVATGGDTVRAIVPDAGDIFSSIEEIGTMDENMRQCAEDGLFYDPDTEECRQGVPPRVTFYPSSGDTFVNVELAYGQERPTNANTNSPAGFSRFGGLDGEDGSYTTP